MRSSLHRSTTAAVLFCLAGSASGQVVINKGQSITEEDLLNGVFNGQMFTLAPGKIFEFNGGSLRRLGIRNQDDPFGFNGSTIVFNSGSVDAGTVISDVNFDMLGGEIANNFGVYSNTDFTLAEGEIGNNFETHAGSNVLISGGEILRGMKIYTGSTVSLSGGTIGTELVVSGTLTISGGVLSEYATVLDGGEVS